jgi:hypothetical protein
MSILNAVLVVAAAIGVLLGFQHLRWRRGCRAAAAKIYSELHLRQGQVR